MKEIRHISDEYILKEARKRVKAKKGWYTHFTTYCAVIGFLFILNLITSPDVWWFIFPALGWGVSIVIHYFAVFGFFSIKGGEWEQKELEKEIYQLRKRRQLYLEEGGMTELPDDTLELKEVRKESRTWDDGDFV